MGVANQLILCSRSTISSLIPSMANSQAIVEATGRGFDRADNRLESVSKKGVSRLAALCSNRVLLLRRTLIYGERRTIAGHTSDAVSHYHGEEGAVVG